MFLVNSTCFPVESLTVHLSAFLGIVLVELACVGVEPRSTLTSRVLTVRLEVLVVTLGSLDAPKSTSRSLRTAKRLHSFSHRFAFPCNKSAVVLHNF